VNKTHLGDRLATEDVDIIRFLGGFMKVKLRGGGGSGLFGRLGLLFGRLGGLTLVLLGLAGSLSLGAIGRSPQGEVVTQQLHNESAVAVRLLGEGVELGDGVVKGLLGEVASTVGRVQDLVVEDREVQGQTEADGVGGRELSLSNVGSALMSWSVRLCTQGGGWEIRGKPSQK
jgi:hypothetical protein